MRRKTTSFYLEQRADAVVRAHNVKAVGSLRQSARQLHAELRV